MGIGKASITVGSRAHDEMILAWLADRAAGQSIRQIAARWGVAPGSVARATNNVTEAET